jgi:DNA-binding CsgD family transcriptional regulator/tetratricopeptide (TPR) repeat protein
VTARVLVGRDRELAVLHRVLIPGGSGCAVVAGEAGIGKSTVVAAALAGRGPVVAGAATEPPAPALRPLVGIAVAAVGVGADPATPALRMHRRVLAALLPGLLDDDGPLDTVHPVVLADALWRLLDTVAGPARPAVLVEDLHWADTDTLATVESMAERCAGAGYPLLVTLRPEGPALDRSARWAQRGIATMVRLGPLDDATVSDLVAARLGCSVAELPPDLLPAVATAGGNPLWIEEIVATVRADGRLHRGDGQWRFSGAGSVVPRTLSAVVARRLVELGRAREVVERVALFGGDVDPADLATPDSQEVAAGLAAGLLVARADGAIGFRHELLRAAVTAAMTPARRRQAAASLLAALEPVPPERLDVAAALAAHAGRGAGGFLLAAARRDLARGLPGTAASTLERALDGAVGEERLEIRELLVHALALAGDADRALADAGPVEAELAERPGTAQRRRALAEAVVRAIAAQGRWSEAGSQVAALRERFPEAATTAALAAVVALESGRFDAAGELAREVLVRGAAQPAARCEAMEVLGRLARRADLDTAAVWFRRAVAAAEEGDLAVWRARALHELATIAQLRSFDLEPMRRARAAAVDAGVPGLVSTVDLQIAAVHGVRFEPERALPAARMMLDTARRLGAHRHEAFAWVLVGQAHAVAGHRREAGVAADEALRLAPGDDEIVGLCVGLCRGLPALLDDDLPVAVEHWSRSVAALERVGETRPYPPWFLWPVLATALDPDGDHGAAARARTDVPELRIVPGSDALWWLADAIARGRAGDRDGAARALHEADRRFAALPRFAGYEHLGRRLAAPAALADGWADPGPWLTRAAEWAGARDHSGFARACRSLAARTGIRRTRAGRGDSAVPAHLARRGVTSREMDVLVLVAEGLTNKEVAQRLYLSPRTVKGHVELLLAKTGATNRTQLARYVEAGADLLNPAIRPVPPPRRTHDPSPVADTRSAPPKGSS